MPTNSSTPTTKINGVSLTISKIRKDQITKLREDVIFWNKNVIEIEKQILNLAISNKNSKNTLIKLADSSEFKANKAYIYYHIWLYTGDNEYKNLASSIFTTHHKKKPKYRFTYFTNKLK